MSADYVAGASETCALVCCGHFDEFTVEHPTRGRIDVCGYHARQMRDALDGVEVSL